jgi:hypothetical protein
MRLATCLLAFAAFTTPLTLSSTPSAAQQTTARPPLPACDGNYNIVRLSEIKPGMMDKFLQAVASQTAWYKSKGSPDTITVQRVIDTKTGTYSTTEAMTNHIQPPSSKQPAHDAGFDAFVALFADSSSIKSSFLTCMAK